MSYRVYQFQPYATDGNYGAEIKHYVDLVPNDEDWIIIADYDLMVLTPHHIHKIREYIDVYPDTGMFLPYTNRVKQKLQILDMSLFDNPNILVHRQKALDIAKQPISVTELNIVISGYFMIFKKATYKKIVPPDGLLGCDNKISKRILNLGMKIRMMNTVYAFHFYRMDTGIKDKSHLKNIPKT
jgi:GT2 family glycosyltransferase